MKPIKISEYSNEDIVLSRGALMSCDEHLNLNRRVLVLTDRDVPKEYVDAVCAKCLYPVRISVWPGKDTNSFANYEQICKAMLEHGFTERDCLVAVGGERIMALGAFVSATYKGGIELYDVPTTFKAQTGKGILQRSYINYGEKIDALGIIKLPQRTLVDTSLLDSLDQRRMANGYAEIIRLALVLDKKLFEFLENDDLTKEKSFDFVIYRSLEIRRYALMNAKSTPSLLTAVKLGSMLAQSMERTQFSFGERLAIAMLPFCSSAVRARLRDLYGRFGLPVVWQYDSEKLFADSVKGYDTEKLSVVRCDEVGTYKVDSVTVPEYHKMIKTVYGGN